VHAYLMVRGVTTWEVLRPNDNNVPQPFKIRECLRNISNYWIGIKQA
jgi:hypothetical protein